MSQYYEYEIKVVNKKHPKYKQIVKLINLSTEHGILQQKVNRFKYGFLLLSYWFERFFKSEKAKMTKQEFDKKNTNFIKFDELINIFLIWIIVGVVIIIIFIIELMYFFLNRYINYYFH